MSRHSLVRVFPFLLAAVCSAAIAQEETPKPSLTEVFQKAKLAFKLGNYKGSLETFDKLDLLAQSASEADRAKLEPVSAFYRGANLAMLGEPDRARAQFEKYLALVPTARLDPGAFPKQVLTLFDETRERVQGPSMATSKPPTDSGWMTSDYARFRPAPGPSQAADEHWADGVIRFLMTKEEREAWQRLSDDAQRGEFVADFWARRDPNPQTPENEFRDEIERRIRYADSHFSADEKSGSATDRGLVFVLLGPPSYVGQKPLMSNDDPVQVARAAPLQEVRLNADGSTTTVLTPREPLTSQTIQGNRDIWYYRRDRLPKVVKYTEVQFEFITRKGYGTAVLERNHDVLTTLDVVAHSTLPSKN